MTLEGVFNKMYGYIYKTTVLKTGLIYVGKHKADHFEPENYIGSGRILTDMLASKKYTWDDFKCELLDTAETLDELNEKEIYWIAKLDATNHKIGYNINEGGDGGPDINGFMWFNDGINEYLLSPEAAETTTLTKGRLIHPDNSDTVWVNNGIKQYHIKKDLVDEYLEKGYKFGMLDRGDVWRQHVAESFLANKEAICAAARVGQLKFFEEHPHWTNQTSFKKGQAAHNKGKVWVTNGKENHYIELDKLEDFLKENPEYKKGCTQKRPEHINRKKKGA